MPGSQYLYVDGSNSKLRPEKATSWTFGLDYKPQWNPDLSGSITYYQVHYSDRVVVPITNLANALSDPAYAPFVLLNPSQALQAETIANRRPADFYADFTSNGYDPSRVIALVQNSNQNASSQDFNGVDLSAAYRLHVADGNLDLSGSTSWLTERQKLLPASPEQTVSGLVFNVPRFKARAGATWHRHSWEASAFANYVGQLTDVSTLNGVAVNGGTRRVLDHYRRSASVCNAAGIASRRRNTRRSCRTEPVQP